MAQLYNCIQSEFEMWTAYSPERKNNLHTKKAKKLPFIKYPDGVPCTEANVYMLGLWSRSLSQRTEDGGTPKTYASHISHLIRYCYSRGWAFTALNDDRFGDFIHFIHHETNKFGKRVRGINQVRMIGQTCIDFLRTVADFHGDETLIGDQDFHAIKVEKKEVKTFVEGMKEPRITFQYTHGSIPKGDSANKRLPIADSAAAAIKKQIDEHKNPYVKSRDTMIYQSLEQTGARRTEVMLLHVDDVREALRKAKSGKSDTVNLQFTTLKRKEEHTRQVPVPVTFLHNLKEYITKVRRKIIKGTIGKENDHGFVFIDIRRGTPLKPDTISTYFNKYKHAAGITDECFAHLIRHAYLTERLKQIILEHKFKNKDEFNRALLNTEQFKMQLQQWSGHTRPYSLNTYINLAFSDLAGVRQTYNAVSLKSAVGLVKDELETMKADLKNSRVTATEIIEKMRSLIDAFEMDINLAIKIDKENNANEESEEEQVAHA
ncbi:site-specific integrase [Photobacterium sp. SDRW27]|uniref:site-specific integrase n=1 Tax=Photobacterium obscurum TaxID=2829490 RepID=UPI0022437CBE|nr:site-specific integrase [Photobacterium obscurum]MCW8327370.1 site-specific integrase [Photobacterium obscurum]